MNESLPLRLGIAGLNHDHVVWILNHLDRQDVDVVGFFEPDRPLAERYAARYGFSIDRIYNNLDELLEQAQPEAVAAFGPIFDHLMVVEACAPRKVHVIVEKPLAVSMEHAARMDALAQQHGIHLLTNYETTWYPTTHSAYDKVVVQSVVGDIRKMVVHDGHKGPRELGCTEDFLEWLTDPVLNGGGAIIDFGCYGANLITWLMGGAEPLAVTAVTQTLKPDQYPHVDDEATIILTYPNAQGIIQASWNWPLGRKDMEIYGQIGEVHVLDKLRMRVTSQTSQRSRTPVRVGPLSEPLNDPFAYLGAVVRGEVVCKGSDLSGLDNNLTVVKILDKARQSARERRTVDWAV